LQIFWVLVWVVKCTAVDGELSKLGKLSKLSVVVEESIKVRKLSRCIQKVCAKRWSLRAFAR
jgi:hypothetical protein